MQKLKIVEISLLKRFLMTISKKNAKAVGCLVGKLISLSCFFVRFLFFTNLNNLHNF